MKLSFSTKGWHNRTFDDFCEIAKDLRFSGIELHNVSNTLFTDKDSAFQDYATAATLRKLYEQKITIPCISSICDISDEKTVESATAEVRECIRIAKNLHIPYIRVRANKHDDGDTARVEKFLSNILPECEEIGVTLLIETSGLYCDTAKLRDMLQLFACDSIAALIRK